jgi:Nucleotidyltransferase domain
MSIPESQLYTWSQPQQTQAAINTHTSIRYALEDPKSLLSQRGFRSGFDYDIYLQGSYRNSTNIRADSDVDVVVQFKTGFYSNIQNSPLYNGCFSPSDYGYHLFKAEVLHSLKSYYTLDIVKPGNKSIKLAKSSNRLNADVIPCIQYRLYQQFKTSADMDRYVEGMALFTQNGNRMVVNYPKFHYEGSVNKNKDTFQTYKLIVRMFKNARNKAIEKGFVPAGIAPSYFLECLLYNAPSYLFGTNLSESYENIINYLSADINNSYVCQNCLVSLFGDTPEQWNIIDATVLLTGLQKIWRYW